MECSNCNGGFSVPKTSEFDLGCSIVLCFVGWNAQTAMGVIHFANGEYGKSVGFCWTGMSTAMGGFLCLRAGGGKVWVFVRRGCKWQWGIFMCQVRMFEVCWYLLDGEAVRKCACIVCASPC